MANEKLTIAISFVGTSNYQPTTYFFRDTLSNDIPMFVECKSGLGTQKSITNFWAVSQSYGSKYSSSVLVALKPFADDVFREKIDQYSIHLIEGYKGLSTAT